MCVAHSLDRMTKNRTKNEMPARATEERATTTTTMKITGYGQKKTSRKAKTNYKYQRFVVWSQWACSQANDFIESVRQRLIFLCAFRLRSICEIDRSSGTNSCRLHGVCVCVLFVWKEEKRVHFTDSCYSTQQQQQQRHQHCTLHCHRHTIDISCVELPRNDDDEDDVYKSSTT